ncbi:MAG: DUF6017 domain-containing protein, partial [Defluviitaleaceae bacterium]|nr:DUF6017 domain-containing protein [Defluviitaleaceae bacterium]
QANPTLENPTQLNKDKATTEKLNTDSQNTHSIPFPPQAPQNQTTDRIGTETAASVDVYNVYREIIHENIEYPHLLERYEYDHERVREIAELMLETVCTSRKVIRIASDDYPAELVKAKFLKLNGCHIEYVLDCLKKNTTEIRNIKKYLLAVLFNAPSTIDSYYTSLVSHDMANGKLQGGKGGASC